MGEITRNGLLARLTEPFKRAVSNSTPSNYNSISNISRRSFLESLVVGATVLTTNNVLAQDSLTGEQKLRAYLAHKFNLEPDSAYVDLFLNLDIPYHEIITSVDILSDVFDLDDDPIMNLMHILLYIEDRCNPQEIARTLSLDSRRTFFRNYSDLGEFFEHGGDYASAERLMRITSNGELFFDYFSDQRDFVNLPNIAENIETIEDKLRIIDALSAIPDNEDGQFYSQGCITRFIEDFSGTYEDAQIVQSISDNPLGLTAIQRVIDFNRTYDNEQFHQLLRLASMKDSDGNYLFRNREFEEMNERYYGHDNLIYTILDQGISQNFVETLNENGLKDYEIVALARLGLSAEEILNPQDTGKPKALIVYPTDDYIQTSWTASEFGWIAQNYDIDWAFVSSADEFKQVVERNDNIDLLTITGHGDGLRVHFGRHTNQDDSTPYLSVHTDLNYLRGHLSPKARILLVSCFSCLGGPDAINIGRHLAKSAGVQVQTATKQSALHHNFYEINSSYPANVSFFYQDHLYSPNGVFLSIERGENITCTIDPANL